jgi:hypothetical protein
MLQDYNLKNLPKPTTRPKLTAETVVEYLDWLMHNLPVLNATHIAHHMTACELAIRTIMGDAQAKATQATLIGDGKIKASASARRATI